MMSELPLYLASASPRRRELVAALGRRVIATVAPVDEDALTATYSGPSDGLAEHLARAKALAACAHLATDLSEPALVLAADTTVVLDGHLLGKPRDDAEAHTMLRAMRGRMHTVITGVAVARVEPSGSDGAMGAGHIPREAHHSMRSLAIATRVHMRAYTDAEIAAYVASGDPFDKAGGYAVQHPGFHPVASIEGCYLAVVGLPLCAAHALLDDRRAAQPAAASPHGPIPSVCPWSAHCRPPLPTVLGRAPA
jgi:septum formation protein